MAEAPSQDLPLKSAAIRSRHSPGHMMAIQPTVDLPFLGFSSAARLTDLLKSENSGPVIGVAQPAGSKIVAQFAEWPRHRLWLDATPGGNAFARAGMFLVGGYQSPTA